MTDLYARLGIDFDQLGCVMLDCEPCKRGHELAGDSDYMSTDTHRGL